MAFIGSAGIEAQLNTLKRQLASKDSELTSIRNELGKSQAELTEAKRGRSDAESKLESLSVRAHQAESSLAAKVSELSNNRLQYDNLQSTLKVTNEKLSQSHKENERLQYELDVASQGSARGKDSDSGRMKELEQKIKARDEEIERLRSQPAMPESTFGGLKKSSTTFFPPQSPPGRSKGRRRSASFSADPRVSNLETEISKLHSSHGLEMDKVSAQLEIARKELDKITNAKLALEKSSQKELDRLRSDLEDANYELDGWRVNGQAPTRAEDPKHVAKMKEMEAAAERMREQLASADVEISRLTKKVEELEGRIAAPSSPDGMSVRQYQREIKTLNSRIQSLEEELKAQDEEILKLKIAVPLPGSPQVGDSENPSLSDSRLAELDEITREHELVVFGLQEEIKSTKKEITRLEELVDKLETRSAEAEDALENLTKNTAKASDDHSRELLESQGRCEALQTELEDAKHELQVTSAHADEMQEQYESCAKSKLDLEQTLADLRETVANRSTESQAQDRVAEIFDHKEKIQMLTDRLRDSEKALGTARSRIADLETSRPRDHAPGSSREILLLQDKVGRLRTERDELRLNLSFVQHEHRFARDAVEASKATAVAELKSTRADLQERLDAISGLERQHAAAKEALDSVTSRLDGVTGSYAAASAEKDELAAKVTSLESNLGEASSFRDALLARVEELDKQLSERLEEAQVQHLINEVALAQHKASKAEMEVYSLRKANKEYEERVDSLQGQLEATREVSSDQPTSRADRPPSRSERPASRSSMGGHVRRISGVYTGETIESLRAERADLQSRVLSRNMRIEAMKNEMRQIKANLQLAEEAAEEVGTEKLEVEQELEALRAATAAAEQDSQSAIRGLVITLAMHRQFVSAAQNAWSDQRKKLEEGSAAIERISIDATTALRSATDEIDTLSKQIFEARAEIQRLSEDMKARTEVAESNAAAMEALKSVMAEKDLELEKKTADAAAVEQNLAILRASLEAATERESQSNDLQSQLDARTEELLRLTTQLAEVRQARDSVCQELQVLQEQHASMRTELESTNTKVQALEASAASDQQEVSRLHALVLDLEKQVVEGSSALESAGHEHAKALEERDTQLAVLRERAQAATGTPVDSEQVAELNERITELETALTLKVQEVDEADDRVREAFKAKTKLEKKVAKLQRHLAAATTADDETAANTAANKIIPVELVEPVTATPRTKAALPVERAPLRNVNIFDTSQTRQTCDEVTTSPGSGLKRQREMDEGEKKVPAECIVLHNSSPPRAGVRKDRVRASFGQRLRGVRGPSD
ncbi:hypothetical protein BD324DRAFT_678089 [Kockovaella imperatae]|uniref:Uncharacterized protein n=1 Tax=Kockovaella imperatae TaxID=4999 RepID=A0A1Y1USZ0_9TREE|nr:hypothetical protein BD324DRAFT_678089 [Kockovaella imperatae]ORX40644.1 hypothetical protein BD324DRAFT_678089 [Kockovaella imperatae]